MPRWIILIVALTGLASGAARADWQQTRWGMSASEVVNIYAEAQPTTIAERSQGPGQLFTALLKMPWSSGDYRFTALFHFDSAGLLSCVYLKLLNDQLAPPLLGSLRQKYGAAAEQATGALYESFRWYTETDAIHLFQGRPATDKPFNASTIRYCARSNSNNRGL